MNRVIDELVEYLKDQRKFLVRNILQNEEVLLLGSFAQNQKDMFKADISFERKEVERLNGFIDELEHIYKTVSYDDLPEPSDFEIEENCEDECDFFEWEKDERTDWADEYMADCDCSKCVEYGKHLSNKKDDFEKYLEEIEQDKLEMEQELNKIKVGDIVVVKDWGCQYSSYREFIDTYGTNFHKYNWRPISLYFDEHDDKLEVVKNLEYSVSTIQLHKNCKNVVAIIQNGKYVWIVDVNGLEKVKENK